MNKNNKLKLTWISFFSYGLTGALVIVTGILLESIAEYFKLPVSSMSNIFTFLNLGILIAISFNAWLVEIIPLKQQLIFGFLLMTLTVAGLVFSNNIAIFSLSIFILGVVSGITMSIGTYLIIHLYKGNQRGAFLLFTDSFFSMAGIIFPMLAGVLLAHHIVWYWIYICIEMIYVIIFILTIQSDFSKLSYYDISVITYKDSYKKEENWGLASLLLALTALCYILGQLSFISWVPEYVISCFKMNIQQASQLVSHFWIAYMVGMWFFSYLLYFFDLQRIVTFLSGISAIFMYLFINTSVPIMLLKYLLALGFFSSAIYTTIITLGSQQTKVSSPKLVNFILTCGTIGTMLTFIVSSPIVAKYGVFTALQLSNLLYVIVFILCFLLGLVSRHRINN